MYIMTYNLINPIPYGEKNFGEHGGGFCPRPVTFEFVNVLRPNLAQLWNFVYSIQKQKN